MSGNNNSRRNGILHQTEVDWLLDGDSISYPRKHRLRIGTANSMADVKKIVEADIQEVSDPPLEEISELFDELEDEADMDAEECAKYLIALAFIITNEPIDYGKILENLSLHPRKEDEMPKDEDRPIKEEAVNFGQDVGDLLAFRRALTNGIKLGKARVDGDIQDVNVPEIVTIDSNTRLFKEPTVDRLDVDKQRVTEMWRDAFAARLDFYNMAESRGLDDIPGPEDPEENVIDRKKALEQLEMVIRLNIDNRIAIRRNMSEYGFADIPEDYLPGSTSNQGEHVRITEEVYERLQQYKNNNDDENGDSLTDSEAINQLLELTG